MTSEDRRQRGGENNGGGREGNDPDESRIYAEAIVRTIAQPILTLSGDLTVESANPAFHRLFRTKPENTVGHRLYELGNGQWDIPEFRGLLEDVLQQRSEVHDFRIEHEFETIGPRVMLLNASRIERPGGRTHRILLAISDVTELERARWELEGRKEYAEKVVDAVREALLILEWDLRVKTANQSFYDGFKVDRAETEGRLVYELGNGQWDIPELRRVLEEVLPKDNTFDDYEVEHEFEQVGRRIMLLNGRRLDHLNLIVLAIRDVTEQRRAELKQNVLVGELQHRVKNILANVRSLAMQTRQNSHDLDEFTQAFDGRLGALARTQDLLTNRPEGDIRLRDIVRQELEARGAQDGEDYSLDGPEVVFPPSAAQAIALTFHELGTNAAKYGALGAPGGRIELSWCIEPDDGNKVVIRWRETGVEIKTPPRKKGFGSRIIQESLPYMLGGSSKMSFHPDGLECVMYIPIPKRQAGV